MSSAADPRPLVYSCSGCSSAAQLANHVALRLDRAGVAEMSCIAGVGGDVASLVRTARSGRPIIALDGCPLNCVQGCLSRHGITADRHYQLQQYGVKKRRHEDFDPVQANTVLEQVQADLLAHPLGGPADSTTADAPGYAAKRYCRSRFCRRWYIARRIHRPRAARW